jgi:hypothetical protein
VCLIYVKANYIHLKGIEVSYFTQKTSTIWYGIAVQGSNYNTFEQINSHHNGHGMVIRDESSHNLVLNCDFHNNYDPLTSGDGYGNADGLEIGYQSSSVENTVRGCRIWANSDDGIDLWENNGNVIIDRCWSWSNGYREDGTTKGGDGGGFKFGKTTTESGSSFKRTITNCISVYNRTKGYNQNGADVKFNFYNNLAYKNPNGFVFYDYNRANVFKNNVSFGNTTENWTGNYSNSTKDHNSYDPAFSPAGPVASASDFMSVDTTGISGKRKSSGDLPDLDFMKLTAGSDLIDAGVTTGTQFAGKAPDLGPFESSLAAAATAPTADGASTTPVTPSTTPVAATAPTPTQEQPKPETVPTSSTVPNGDGKISLSPFPVKNVISVKNFVPGTSNSVLKIYDFSGKLCQESSLGDTTTPQVSVSIQPGCYIARIMNGNQVQYVQKLIIVK